VNLQYSGEEQIAADADTVWRFVNDAERVANCLPNLRGLTVRDARHFDAVVGVAVGPMRGDCTFTFELQPDRFERRLTMKVTGGGFGSGVDVTAAAEIVPEGAGTTTLCWNGAAAMRGPVAAVSPHLLDAEAQKLIAETLTNVNERLAT
jgi:uncharacterized protein